MIGKQVAVFDREKLKPIFEEFHATCDMHYSCFVVTCRGFSYNLDVISGTPDDRKLLIGNGVPGQAPPISAIGIGTLRAYCQPDAEFTDISAKSLVVSLYAYWNEYTRPKIARALALEPAEILWDAMGEIRKLRNVIIHDSSELKRELDLPALGIKFDRGRLLMSDRTMSKLMTSIKNIRLRFSDVSRD